MKTAYNVCLLSIAFFCCIPSISYTKVQAEISYGELVDKISILMIKSERISDPEKLKNIFKELESLLKTLEEHVGNRADVTALLKELKSTNEALWNVEDLVRLKERAQDFGKEFVALARSVYAINDHRFVIKKKVDALLGSPISEEKSFDYL